MRKKKDGGSQTGQMNKTKKENVDKNLLKKNQNL